MHVAALASHVQLVSRMLGVRLLELRIFSVENSKIHLDSRFSSKDPAPDLAAFRPDINIPLGKEGRKGRCW
jgi:hypothetical protein